ncbi:hypothetical protein [Celeribacter indicus]|uniref:SCP2 domain-containing protein n=1 Tax=Celeribacter indicus TaxID=1208324 RepID=A0A0B5DXK3_9RHOB|nr:hypothetical protein [Celeribacter indicus]AJE45835.1 hypothetical protein P73_1120 [Celeribacter indicus]SDW61789.1 hypothetical protein SAMN05443573_10563 [Celeribacter indicus]
MGETDLLPRLSAMAEMLAGRAHLARLGALFSETVLIEVGPAEYYLTFHRGRIEDIRTGPSRKIPWRFALRVDHAALMKFWEPVPEPGFHDIFGFVKTGRGRIEGDILVLVKNLRFFKEFMALGREVSA